MVLVGAVRPEPIRDSAGTIMPARTASFTLVPSQRAAAAPRSSARLTPEGSGPVGGGANRGLDDRARGRHLIGSWANLDSPFEVLAQFLL